MSDSEILSNILNVLEWTWEMRDDVLSGELEPQRYIDILTESLNNPAYCKESHGIIIDALNEMTPPYDKTIYRIKMDYEMAETKGWLDFIHDEYRTGYLAAGDFEEKLEQALEKESYPEVREAIKEFTDNVANTVLENKLEDEWGNMPTDDKGATAKELISNLRGYGITFSPALPGYYFVQQFGGVRYEVRSSFTTEGKSLGSILEKVIVDRAASDCQRDK